ncbi:hypothetical protein GCM10027037_04470 [Mucilaginibacter koreensis]
MKKFTLPVLAIFLATAFSSCNLVEGAFKAGFIVAIILALLVGLLIWIFHIVVHFLSKKPAIQVNKGYKL